MPTPAGGGGEGPRCGLAVVLCLLAALALAAALRLPRLATIPNGLIPDEALAGYDAWSLLKTGRDSHGERLPLFPLSTARLNAFYMYATVPSVAALGLTEIAVRIPAVVIGLLGIPLVFLLVRREEGAVAGTMAALLLAASPWHVLLSRTGFDWVVLPTLATLAVLLTIAAAEGQAPWMAAGAAAATALYSYAPARLLVPLLLAGVLVIWRDRVRAAGRRVIPGFLAFVLLAAPVAVFMASGEGLQRLHSVAADESGAAAVRGFLARYAAAFSPGVLLAPTSDPELHRLRSTGLLYPFEPPLIVLGALASVRDRSRIGRLLVWWLLAAPLTVSIHRDGPGPVLLATALPAYQALAGIGAARLWRMLPRARTVRLALASMLTLVVAATAVRMARDLYFEFPVYAAEPWSHGVREMVRAVEKRRAGYDGVWVDGSEKHIYSLIQFYSRLDPRQRQGEVAVVPGRADRSQVGAYRIGDVSRALDWNGRWLVWTTRPVARRALPGRRPILTVPWPDGRPHYLLFEVEGQPAGRGPHDDVPPL